MYFGSVRFFKNLILLAVIIFIRIPTCTSFHYKSEYENLKSQQTMTPLISSKLEDCDWMTKYTIEPQTPSYQDKYPDFYAPQTLDASEAIPNTVYLTFDDGPSQRTYEILDILAKEDVKATFFVVGATDSFSRQAMRDIVANGHTIAMHTYSHKYTEIYSSVEAYLDDMYQIFTLIKEATGVTPTHFRFPGGSKNVYNTQINKEIISEMLRRGFVPFDWNVSSGDASSTLLSPATINYNVMDGMRKTNRRVVLMHDSSPHTTTVQALPEMIKTLKEQGYSFDKLTPQTKPVLFAYNEK